MAHAQDATHSGNVVRMEAFVSTGTRTRQAADTTPVRVEIVPVTESVRMGATSFADSMEYVPGVQVESNCQNCNTTEIRLMGLGSAYNQIAFDGLPLLSSLAGVYGVEQVPAAFIQRIEVVKGGGSSLYGANAVAGVVNIISKRPDASGRSLDYRFETTHGSPSHQVGLTHDFVGTKSVVSAHVQAVHTHELDLNDDAYTERTRRRMQVAGLRGRFDLGALTLSADLNFTHEYRRGGNHLDRPAHLSNITEQLDTRRTAATLSLEPTRTSDFDYKLIAATAWTQRDSYYGGLGEVVTDHNSPLYDPAAYQDALDFAENQYATTDNPLYVIDTQFNHYLSGQTLSWGLQAEYEEIEDQNIHASGTPIPGARLSASYSNVALFAQHEWQPHPQWTLLSGLRVDRNNQLDQPVLSPRLSLSYVADKYLTLRGSLSTGFRAPRIFDEDLHIDTLGAAPIRIVNRPGLSKESALTANIGGVWNPRPLPDVLAFEFNVYTARLRDAFQLSEVTTDPNGQLVRQRYNAGSVRGEGIELNAAYSFTPRLRADLGLVWQRSRHDQPVTLLDDGAGLVISTTRFNKTPEHFAVLQLQYENPERLDWGLGIRHTGPMHVLNNTHATFERKSAFTVFDVSIGKHFTIDTSKLEWRVGIRNLTDARQKDLEQGAARDSTYVYGPRQPRSFFSSVRLEF